MSKPPELTFSPSLMSFLEGQGFLADKEKIVTSKDMRKMFPYLIWYITEVENYARTLLGKLKHYEVKDEKIHEKTNTC